MTDFVNTLIGLVTLACLMYLLWYCRKLGRLVDSYAAEKGKNLATREDVEELTQRMEGARHPFNERLEQLKGDIQFRNVSLEKRLEVHQQAYAYWCTMMHLIHDPWEARSQHCNTCKAWWLANCLYLSPEARKAFSRAIISFAMHKDFVEQNVDLQTVKANWCQVEELGSLLAAAVQLPDINESSLLADINESIRKSKVS